ncbi:Arm DNA-binding domain-containing protein [Luteibacter jiangsuensis]
MAISEQIPWRDPPAMKLPELRVRKAVPNEKPKKLSDGAGICLVVMPTGGKLWRLKYRIDGKEETSVLRRYPGGGLAYARVRRDHARRQIALELDSNAVRLALRQARGAQAQATVRRLKPLLGSGRGVNRWLRSRHRRIDGSRKLSCFPMSALVQLMPLRP